MLFSSSGSEEPWYLCLLLFGESLGKLIWKDLFGCHEKGMHEDQLENE